MRPVTSGRGPSHLLQRELLVALATVEPAGGMANLPETISLTIESRREVAPRLIDLRRATFEFP